MSSPGPHRRRAQRGLSLIELVAVISVMMVAIPPLTGLYTEVASGSVDDTYQSAALTLAESLMEEIVSRDFEDPDLEQGSFGTEEERRRGYDDVDDYDGLDNTPPVALDGTDLDDHGGMRRRVIVDNVALDDPDPVSGVRDGSTPMKRIRVIVSWTGGRGGELTLSTLRTRLVEEPQREDLIDQATASETSAAFGGSDKKFTVDLMSVADHDLVFESYSLSAVSDQALPSLTEIRLGTDKIHKNAIDSLPTGSVTLNSGSDTDRTLAVGQTRTARFTFRSDFGGGVADYEFTLTDADGFDHDVSFSVDWGD